MVLKKKIPTELENVAFVEDINAIQEKVDRCYSKDRYEEFQEAVEKITSKWLKGTFGWAIVIWIITVFASFVLQKIFHII